MDTGSNQKSFDGKIDQENYEIALRGILKKYAAIQRVAYFGDLTRFLEDNFMKSMCSKELSVEAMHSKLKKSKFARQFEWLKKTEPESGTFLFFLVGERKEKAILIHLFKLRKEASEIRIFLKHKSDFDLLPQYTFDFIEKLLCTYKTIHSKGTKSVPSKKIFLYPKDKQTMETITSVQLSLFLLIKFLSNQKNPSIFNDNNPLPCISRPQYWEFFNEIKLLMADYKRKLSSESPKIISKRNKIDFGQISSTQIFMAQAEVKSVPVKLRSIGIQTDLTVTHLKKQKQNLERAYFEIQKLKQEVGQLKTSIGFQRH